MINIAKHQWAGLKTCPLHTARACVSKEDMTPTVSGANLLNKLQFAEGHAKYPEFLDFKTPSENELIDRLRL